MSNTVLAMPSEKKPRGKKPNRFPSRDKVKYAGIPKEYWDMLHALTADGEKYEGRSVSYLTKMAVRKFLHAEGKVDEKGRSLGKPGG